MSDRIYYVKKYDDGSLCGLTWDNPSDITLIEGESIAAVKLVEVEMPNSKRKPIDMIRYLHYNDGGSPSDVLQDEYYIKRYPGVAWIRVRVREEAE